MSFAKRHQGEYPDWKEWLEKRGIMKLCAIEGCGREHEAHGLCHKHYERKRYHKLYPDGTPYILRSDNLRRVNLDSVAVGWLVGVLKKLPSAKALEAEQLKRKEQT